MSRQTTVEACSAISLKRERTVSDVEQEDMEVSDKILHFEEKLAGEGVAPQMSSVEVSGSCSTSVLAGK